MSIALAQSVLGSHVSLSYNEPVGASGDVTVTLGATTAGSLLVLVGYYHIHATSQTVETGGFNFPTGGSGLTWRQVISGGYLAGTTDRANAIIFFCGNSPAQSNGTTITLHLAVGGGGSAGPAGNVFGECAIYEFTGTALSNSSSIGPLLDADAALSNQTSGTPHTANLTTTQTDLIIVASSLAGSTLSAGSGFQLGQDATNLSGVVGQLQYALNVAPGSIATSFLSGTPSNWGAGAIAFKPNVPANLPFTSGFLFNF